MVAARIPLCSVSAMTRSANFSVPLAEAPLAAKALSAGSGLAGGAAAGMLGPATERDDGTGELAALVAASLLGFEARPAACLHRSDSASLCSLRQATIRPPPGCTPAHSVCASSAQAARIAAS